MRSVVPQAVMDAGGEQGGPLHSALRRRIDDLAGGQILQVISLEPRAQGDVVGWCDTTGHVLLHLARDGVETRYWIRKTDPS